MHAPRRWLAPVVLAVAIGSCHRATGPTSGPGAPETEASERDDDPMGVEVHRLRNGMTVYVTRDPTAPQIAAWIGIAAGARHDPAASTGLAHYLEHMMFKGTDELGAIDHAAERPYLDAIAGRYRALRGASAGQRAAILREIDTHTQAAAALAVPNELDRLYAALGIVDVNAYTAAEQTVYVATVPSHRFEHGRRWSRSGLGIRCSACCGRSSRRCTKRRTSLWTTPMSGCTRR